jgi:CheY-like chemotaxis protein
VVNARDAMPAGGLIAVETCDGSCDRHPGAEGPAFVEIRVRDSGVGIDPDALDRIFDPFYTTKQDGTGLGLATVYGVVSQSGGEVLCDSVPGQGTTFRVRLPAIGDREEPASLAAPPAEGGAGQRVLLVEDDPGVRRFARRALTNAGYQVTEATDGEEAQRLLAELDGDFDLLLTDVVMPGTGGLELVDWARRRWPDLPTLFMSGYPHAELAARGMTLEEHEIMAKPFEIAVILHRVHAAMAGTDPG